MKKVTAEIRNLMAGHEASDWQLFEMLLKVVDEQQSQIEALGERLNSINVATGNIYERHENQVADLRKQIERLKGTHGA